MQSAAEQPYVEALKKASAKIRELLVENESLQQRGPIAVIGQGCRFPGGADSPEKFWELLAQGVDAVGEIPPERWDANKYFDADPEASGRMYTRSGAFLGDVAGFDAGFFGITPKEAEALDPQQRLLLEVSWEAFEDAALNTRKLRGSRTGVFIGMSSYDYIQAHVHSGDVRRITPYSGSGVMFSTAAGRLAYFYDFRGPCLALDTACSSSLISLHLAIQSLRRGESDLALAGGVSLMLSLDSFIALCKVKALSADGRCRAFDDSASGYGRGEGCGLVVLKRLADAQRDGDRILAVLKGSASNHDGRSNGLTAPNGLAQQAVLRAALADAGLPPEALDYVEAHGTGTALGDPIEFNALSQVFGVREPGKHLWLGSVKTNIGHTEAAAGIAGVLKVILALRRHKIPASLHFDSPNQHIAWDQAPIRVVSALQEWPADNSPRAGGVSSFGLSGTNAHIIIEEAPSHTEEDAPSDDRLVHILTLSAASSEPLREIGARYGRFLENFHDSNSANGSAETGEADLRACPARFRDGVPDFPDTAEDSVPGRPTVLLLKENAPQPSADIADLCFTAASRTHFRERIAICASNALEVREGLTAFLEGRSNRHLIQRSRPATGKKGVVFLFSGQGSQYVGMGRELYGTQPVFRKALESCQEILGSDLRPGLLDLLYAKEADDTVLRRTEVAQPVLFALQYALAELWKSWGVHPAAVAGHSIGEFAAACIAGIFSLDAGLRLATERGRRMQSLPAGGMAVVFASAEIVHAAFREAPDEVCLAAVNTPDCVTVSGEEEALNRLLARLARDKIKSRRLAMAHAFHSPRMAPMVEGFEKAVAQTVFQSPQAHFYSTATGDLLPAQELISPKYWATQILQPVCFLGAVQALAKDGYGTFLEIGPSDTLTAFARQCLGPNAALTLSSLRQGLPDWRRLTASAAALYVHGTDLDWEGFDRPYRRRKMTLPTYPFQRKPYWLEVGPLRPGNVPIVSSGEGHAPPVLGATAPAPMTASNPETSAPPPEQGKDQMENVNQIAETLANLLAEIGGFAASELDRNQNLLGLGLDSLMLLKMGQTVERRYGIELQISQFFQELSSLNDLAAYIARHAKIRGLVAGSTPTLPTTPRTSDASPRPRASAALSGAPAGPGPQLMLPMLPVALGDVSSVAAIFQQQLQSMSQLASQNLERLSELMREQLALLGQNPALCNTGDLPVPSGGSPVPPILPQSSPPPPASKTPSTGATEFRGLNLGGSRMLNNSQREFVEDVVRRHIERTRKSKEMTQQSRCVLADWKHTLSFWTQLKEAKYPIISARSAGARFWDVDGNEYIDLAMGMGVHFFGHKPCFILEALQRQMEEGIELGTQCDLTGRVAVLIHELTGVERVTFCNTGSEAVMVAIRLARAATRRHKLVIFRNSYHGIFDGVLAAEDEGRIVPVGLGTPPGMVQDVMVLEYGADESLEVIAAHAAGLAAVLVEPVQSRNPDLQPQGFLKKLRRLTQEKGIALIFDEMINGFRIHPGGAQAWFGITADIVAYGKIVGGGLPIGVVAGRARFLDYIDGGVWQYGDKSGPQSEMIYFGGTFGRNPMTMAAAHAALLHLKEKGAALQGEITARTIALCDSLNYWFERQQVPLRAKHFASQWRLVPVSEHDHSQPIEMELLFLLLMGKGVYTWERRICFLSAAHGDAEVETILNAIKKSIEEIRAAGFPFTMAEGGSGHFYSPSSPQRRLYVLSQRRGGQLAYHLPQAFWVDGPLHVDRLEDCFREIIRRHASLRTSFTMIDGELVAKVADEPQFAIERSSPKSGAESEDEVVQALLGNFLRPFELSQAPLLRVAVAGVGQRHLLLADAHHSVVDGISFNIIAQELMALYEGRALAEINYDLRGVREVQDAMEKSEGAARDEVFWREQLSGPLPLLILPTDFPRPAEPSFRGDHIRLTIGNEMTGRLKEFSRETGVSLYMLLLAAYQVLLYRLSGQEDVLVGGAVSGRRDRQLASAVGMFVNTVVFRGRPQGAVPFRRFLEAVKRNCLGVYDHQDYPFELMARLDASRPHNRNALFDTLLSYENANERKFQIQDLHFTARDFDGPAAMFDFSLEIIEEAGALHLNFSSSTDLFRRETVSRWIGYFRMILAGVLADPDQPLGRIQLLDAAERERWEAFNNTSADYPADKTLTALFEEQAQRTPGNAAVVFGETVLTYRELNAQADRVAQSLRSLRRIQPGDFVGIFLDRSEKVVVAILGILKAGGVYVPLDVDYPEDRIDFMISDSDCRAILTSAALKNQLPSDRQGLALEVETIENADRSHSTPVQRRNRQPDDVAYVIYTSGSTGRPKGCQVTHRNVVRLLRNSRHDFDFHSADVWVVAHSFCFDFSVWEMYGALLNGARVVVARREEVRDAEVFLDLIKRHRVTVLNQTPGAFYALIEAELKNGNHTLAQHLRCVIFGGDRLEPAYLRKWTETYPPDRIALINMYGITETTVHVTYYRLKESDIVGPAGRSIIGRPIPETTVYVCDEYMGLQPVGVPGEIYVGGSGVSQGYLNRPELTAERFIPSRFRKDERLYRTGDLGRMLADGNLEYLGRNDNQVQIRGYRIELGEITHQLLRHPQVQKAFVVDRDLASGGRELVAYLVGSAELNVAALRQHLSTSLPDYMIPSHFVPLRELPLTANGKVDRQALPPPETSSAEIGAAYTAPRNDVEETIARVWEQVLRHRRVGVHDNYFELGGDSIKALQIVNRLYQAGIKLSLGQIFEARTIAGLAPLMGEAALRRALTPSSLGVSQGSKGLSPLPELRAEGSPIADVSAGPINRATKHEQLTPIQHWFFAEHSGRLHHFNQAVLLKTRERTETEALRQAWTALHRHHEALRTRFGFRAGERYPKVLESVAPHFEIVDLRPRPGSRTALSASPEALDAERASKAVRDPNGTSISSDLETHALTEHANGLQRSFALESAPLARVALYHMSDGDRLVLILHHLIVDGVSWRILLEDLAQAYAQVLRGDPIHLAAPRTSFLHWAEIEVEYARSPQLLEEASYWAQIESVPPLAIPPDFTAPDRPGGDAETVNVALEQEDTEALLTRAHRTYETQINDLLLTALARAARRWCGPNRVRLLLEGHGREEVAEGVDISRTIGWFTTLFPAVLDLGETDQLPDQIRSIRDELRRIPRKGIGYGVLRYLTPPDLRTQTTSAGSAGIVFNYLGQFDEERDGFFSLATESAGRAQADDLERSPALEIEGLVTGGQLRLSVTFNRRRYRSNTLRLFLNAFKDELLAVIAHCAHTRPAAARIALSPRDWELLRKQLGISRDEVEEVSPLAPLQEGLFFHALEEASKSYFEQFSYRLRGELDRACFASSWQELARRHPTLRTAFLPAIARTPRQVVLRNRSVEFHYQDLRALREPEQAAAVRNYGEADRARLFDLGRDPLVRVAVLQRGENDFEIVWSHHHIILDGWSLGIVHEELLAIYQALRAGKNPALPPAPPYRLFLEWLGRRDPEFSRQFWSTYLAGSPGPASAPGINLAGRERGYSLAEHIFLLDRGTTAALVAFAARHGLTMNCLLQTVWGVLLGSYNLGPDVVFGAVVSGRPPELPDVERMVGLFLQTIPIRICLEQEQTFLDLARRVQSAAIACEPHHHFPLAEMQMLTGVQRPLFDHVLVFENYPLAAGSLPMGWQIEDVRGFEQMHYDFSVVIHPGKQIEVKFTFNAHVLAREQCQRLEEHLSSILSGVLRFEQARLGDLGMRPDETGSRPTEETVSIPGAGEASGKTVLDLFELQVGQKPENVAVEQGGKTVTYRELNRRAQTLALALHEHGIGRGEVVALFLRNGIDYIASLLAVQKAGGIFVPIDVDLPPRRMEAILNKVAPKAFVTCQSCEENLRSRLNRLGQASPLPVAVFDWNNDGALHRLEIHDAKHEPVLMAASSQNLPDRPQPADSLYVLFTSGSTGEPKPILSSHEGLRHFIEWERDELRADSALRAGNLALTTFDVSLRDIFLPLVVGGTVCVPDLETRMSGPKLLGWLGEKRVTLLHVVPSVFRLLLKEMESTAVAAACFLPDLRFVLFAGEALYGSDVVRARRWLGGKPELFNLYGPSETTLAKAFLRIPETIADETRMIPIGKPIRGTRIFLIRENRPAAPGVIGEIHIQPPFSCLGYFRSPEMTAERFVINPLTQDPKEIVYRTGDMGRLLPDGQIEFIGRLDRQVKVNGVRVELAEIDHALRANPEVDQAFVVARKMADGENVLACYYTEKRPIDPPTLRERLSEYLPQGLIPHYFLKLEAFPLNLNGKIDARALPKPEDLIFDRIAYEPPVDEIEARLAELWSEILGHKRVGVHSPFLEIGGNSLRAVRIMARLNREFGTNVTIRQFFQSSTIRMLAGHLRAAIRTAGGLITPLPPAPDYAVSHSQRRLWMLEQLGVQPLAYSLPAAFLLEGPLDVRAFERALAALVERHEALRTVFLEVNGEPRQRIQPDPGFRMETVDLSQQNDPEGQAHKLALEHAERPFDLATGPLLSVRLLKLAPLRHLLLVNLHHIISDAWSVSLMVKETVALYRAFTRGNPNPLPPLGIQYKDFAAWQNALLAGEAARAHREYWHAQLAPPLEPLVLPHDGAQPALPTFRGERVSCGFGASATELLRRFSRTHGGTQFTTVIALVQVLLFRYTGQTDIIVGSPVSNRNLEELEDQIGFYVNTIALRDRIKGEESFLELFHRVKGTVTSALEHAVYPFDLLVEELVVPRDVDRTPIFDVMVVWQDGSRQTLELDDVRITEFNVAWGGSKFSLSFEFVENGDGSVTLNLEYNRDLFRRERIERLAAHFSELLQQALENPAQPVGVIDFLPPSEREQLLRQNPVPEIPTGKTVVGSFAEVVAAQPDNVAVICEGVELTYLQLDERSDRLAEALNRQGAGRGDIVAVLLERSEWLVIAFLGVQKCGGVYLPIDPIYPIRRIEYMLNDSRCALVVTEPGGGQGLALGGRLILDVRSLGADPAKVVENQPVHPDSGLAEESKPPGARTAMSAISTVESPACADKAVRAREREITKADDLAYLIYTSGSTGQPKGVLLEHGGAVNLAHAQRIGLGISPSDRILQFAPSSFDASVWEMLMALLHGASLVIAGPDRIRDPREFVRYLREKRVNVATLPPTYLAQLAPDDLDTLELLITAGEPPVLEQALALSRRLRYVNAYGPTEATVCATWHQVNPNGRYEDGIPIGRPIPNAEVFILDERGQLAPIGIPGEICLGGCSLARGYLNQPALTEQRFVPHPFRPGARLYRTGDLGYRRADGEFLFLGRNDHQIKIRGHRVELGEIEQCLLEHPHVKQAAVVATHSRETVHGLDGERRGSSLRESNGRQNAQVRPARLIFEMGVNLGEKPSHEPADPLSPNGGEKARSLGDRKAGVVSPAASPVLRGAEGSDKTLAAYVVLDNGLDLESLREHLLQKLPAYMVPACWVRLDTLPLLPNGKVDRAALPEPEHTDRPDSPTAPRDDLESQLAAAWQEVLKRPVIGIHDRFFEVGGDSIKAIQIVSRLRQAGLKVEMRDFLQFPTVAGLAGRMRDGAVATQETIALSPSAKSRVELTPAELDSLFQNE